MPVYNEEGLLPAVLERVRAVPLDKEIILVDDCSTDGSREILRREAGQPNVRVLYHDKNQGKGAAFLAGVQSLRGDIDLVIFIDADLIGLSEKHLRIVSDPVLNQECEMAVAGFRKGYWRTDLSQ